MKRNKLFLYSLTSLAVMATSAVSAQEIATAPTLEGGFEAMIGGFLAVPSSNNTTYYSSTTGSFPQLETDAFNTDGEYKVGIQAAIGYVFPETANAIELSWRNFDSASSNAQEFPFSDFDDYVSANGDQKNAYEDWDLMISQFLDIGTHVQMRFLGGISYLSKLDQTQKNNALRDNEGGLENFAYEYDSSYRGLGPRIGTDARYDFGDAIEGFGIVGGFSVAYFLGNLDASRSSVHTDIEFNGDENITLTHDTSNTYENHAVTNLRANLGIDYVYFFDNEELSTLGLELGYEVDTYLNGIGQIDYGNETSGYNGIIGVSDVTFSGPYLNLKGVF